VPSTEYQVLTGRSQKVFGWGTASAVPFNPRNGAGFRECVRTTIEHKRWSEHHQDSSRVAAECESPARKCRVKCGTNARVP